MAGDSVIVEDPVYGAAFEGAVEYGAYGLPGLHVAANVVTGDNPQVLEAQDGDVELRSFLGFQGWGEFVVPTEAAFLSGVGPAFRADRFDPDSDVDDNAAWFFTPGLNLYFGSNAKLMLNYDVLVPENDELDTESAFRVQTQVLF